MAYTEVIMRLRIYIREFPKSGFKVCIMGGDLIILKTITQHYKEIHPTGIINFTIDRTIGVKTVLERLGL